MTSVLVNLDQFGITEKDVKIIVEYLVINQDLNIELIRKIIKLGNYIKKIKKEE